MDEASRIKDDLGEEECGKTGNSCDGKRALKPGCSTAEVLRWLGRSGWCGDIVWNGDRSSGPSSASRGACWAWRNGNSRVDDSWDASADGDGRQGDGGA